MRHKINFMFFLCCIKENNLNFERLFALSKALLWDFWKRLRTEASTICTAGDISSACIRYSLRDDGDNGYDEMAQP